MNKVYYMLLILLCAACAKTPITGTYVNQCMLYESPEAVITLNTDGTFTYVFPYIRGEYVEGLWKVDGDTLTLESKFFVRKEEKSSVEPEHEYAHFPKLIVKGKKLYEVSSDEKRKRCYFVRKK